MKTVEVDTLVIGGGAAGLAAAHTVHEHGYAVALAERDEELGGVLLQCIHNGFGLQEFREELTGPEYAERWIRAVESTEIRVFTGTTVMELGRGEDERKQCIGYSPDHGAVRFLSRSVVLAMGCRERNRGNVMIPGTRPAGVYTAGLAQKLVNMDGYIPGKDVVIVGSGDIGLIMARRMTWVGSRVHGVVEIQPYPSGLTRNISQCLHDFDIPLYLSHIVSKIKGRDRVEEVEITPLEDGVPDYEKTFPVACDTLLLSVGLIPENELSKQLGITLSSLTGGPTVNSMLMTEEEGVFAAGNVLHVHDLVDYVSEEARSAGSRVAEFLKGARPGREIGVKAGANIRYVNPGKINPDETSTLFMRPLIVENNAVISLRVRGEEIKRIRKPHIQPSEMIQLKLRPAVFKDLPREESIEMEVSASNG
jgi:NADPH-dependent 2,4-dienoyl-CoA reductase/sulfur reductase-like enzyme